MFLEALTRFLGPTKGCRPPQPEQIRGRAKELWAMLHYPLGKRGFRKVAEGRGQTDYLVAMLQALMLAMPHPPPEKR